MKSKELRAQRAKLVEDARAFLDEGTPEALAKFNDMHDEADKLKAQIDALDAAEAREAATYEQLRASASRQRISPDEAANREQLESSTFMTWVRRGAAGLNDEQREVFNRRFQNALGTTPDTAGGYTVPQGPMQKLVDAQKAYGGMMTPGVATIIDTDNGDALPIPTDNDTANEGVELAENSQVTTQDVTFGAVTLNGYTYTSKLVLVSNQLLQDSVFDLESFLMEKLGVRIARVLNRRFTTGTGASQPTGFITAAALGYTCGGSTSSGETTAISSDDLIELEHSVDAAYRRPNGRYMMSDPALKQIKKLKDAMGRPLWLPGLADKEPDTINSYPYTINFNMDAPAASAKPVAFGDFSLYYIRRISGTRVLRLVERYADFNQVGFVAFQRWDGNLIDAGTHPVKYLQNSAT